MNREDQTGPIGEAYASGQLAKAFITARSHTDPQVRANAERRVTRWEAVLRGMASRRLRIGSRAPVDDLPVWVTPEVVRGGFATGLAAAEGALTPHEARLADHLGVPRARGAVFAACLTERGLAHLRSLLRSGRYRVTQPEEAALLTVAWLVDQDDVAGALWLVEAIEPFSDRLCFVPRAGDSPRDLEVVSRDTVGGVRGALDGRRPNRRVETMREALTVWNPFADELLDFWLAAISAAETGADTAIDTLRDEAERHRARYDDLARDHRLCTKHRDPKENLATLVGGLDRYRTDGQIPKRVVHAVSSMVARRGNPGSPRHRALRAAQAANASVPAHHLLARIMVDRLAALPPDRGIDDVAPIVAPVTADEAAVFSIPTGTAMPPSVHRAVARAMEGPVDDLLDRGLIPSAEVLARLVPQIAAATTASGYPDQASQWLAAQSYLAFRNRRSLLLLDHQHQVTIDELPWVRALAEHRSRPAGLDGSAPESLRRLAELTVRGFPATLVPNPLVRELTALADEARVDVPFVEELAADIFMGSFSSKFLRAAQMAGDVLGDESLYSRYYGIDHAEIAALPLPARPAGRTEPPAGFASICRRRAGVDDRPDWSVARNGTIIEQAQILTTHNLAALVGPVGLGPVLDGEWSELARRCFAMVCQLVATVDRHPRPLRTVKDAAYAWRHMVFFLAQTPPADVQDTVASLRERISSEPAPVRDRLDPVILGLEHVVTGGSLDVDAPAGAHRFLGWVVGQHWMLRSRQERA